MVNAALMEASWMVECMRLRTKRLQTPKQSGWPLDMTTHDGPDAGQKIGGLLYAAIQHSRPGKSTYNVCSGRELDCTSDMAIGITGGRSSIYIQTLVS
jgi:hypothetical protein